MIDSGIHDEFKGRLNSIETLYTPVPLLKNFIFK
jgi:hypothetical protein